MDFKVGDTVLVWESNTSENAVANHERYNKNNIDGCVTIGVEIVTIIEYDGDCFKLKHRDGRMERWGKQYRESNGWNMILINKNITPERIEFLRFLYK